MQELITCLLAICIRALHTVNVEYFEFRSCIFHQHFACAQVLLRDSLSLLSRGEGGVTRETFILCVLEVKQKNEKKKCPELFKKNNPCDLTMKKNKKKQQQQKEISSVKALERHKHGGYETCSSEKVRTLKLQFQAQKLGNYNFIYIFSCSKD